MLENVYRELRGEIPGLLGDARFGASVIQDKNNSRMVERIAIEQQEVDQEEEEEEEEQEEEEEEQSANMLSDLDSD